MLSQATRTEVIATARRDAHDCYLSALLAPMQAREDLLVLAAFEGELTRIIETVGEPMLAEIRLQWWRDTVSAMNGSHQSGHPVADALANLVAAGSVSTTSLLQSIDARSADTGTEPIETDKDLNFYLDRTDGAALARAISVTSAISGVVGPDRGLIEAAGRSVGLVRILLDIARRRAAGWPLLLPISNEVVAANSEGQSEAVGSADDPELFAVQCRKYADHALIYLDKVRPGWAEMSLWHRAALGPVALVGPYLQGLQRLGCLEPRPRGVISPISRVTRLWWAVRFARL